MLTPMMVQYLVGLCCLQHDPDAIDIILGDNVYDPAAGIYRDVDVTVTIKSADGVVEAFKAAEVKAESRPLDVTDVEQLCMKFADMPEVTHKAIFSCSGYSAPARRKAESHSVDLYTFMPCDTPIGKFAKQFSFKGSCLLYWINYETFLIVPNAPGSFIWRGETPLKTSSSKEHKTFHCMQELVDNILIRSTKILFMQEPAKTVLRTFIDDFASLDADYLSGPAWPHTHTIDVTNDEVYIELEGKVCRIEGVTIQHNV